MTSSYNAEEHLQHVAARYANIRHDCASISSAYEDTLDQIHALIRYRVYYPETTERLKKYQALAEKYAQKYLLLRSAFVQAQDELRTALKEYLRTSE